ncbi:MAG: tRNA pseudouridine(13) synthase TruD [Candidatus Parvarchaeota archaeon]|nr:tRNA pseudouridine(13) synthase TruD [Candidatus Parvarchaeum tengchongense]MCW1295695.1 tRNA pseudouridine(13) synthase TruD [Candidatus Parvarchaeum tengchongense]MCW1298756.1 tRNA pseudouridine(13) synthase TruD [Candidatus Parvarchaeum tengchongense]MCW1311853.1 tRNA pseudouridine(13) synthase TruD [Candidatus Parvarchaeum tengchongense]
MLTLEQIGIENFHSYNIKGSLFEREEDFKVQEIEEDGAVLKLEREEEKQILNEKKDYLSFTLVKRGISTPEAVKILSRNLHISFKRIAYNGNKDKRALTSQRITIFKLDAEKLKINSERMFVRDIAYSGEPCKIGKLYGNSFTVFVRNFDSTVDIGSIPKEISKLPNFYGPQRFGASSLNIEISRHIIKREFREAFMTMVFNERSESKAAAEARILLRETFLPYLEGKEIDKSTAEEVLSRLPHSLYFESESLKYLLQHKNDYIGAIRTMPKYARLLILQSMQYLIFNKTLSRAIERYGIESLPKEIPVVGFSMELGSDNISQIVKEVMEEEGINDLKMLKIESMPEASLKVFQRQSILDVENFSIERKDENAIIKFNLKKGSYATVVLLKLFGNLSYNIQ